MENKNVDLARAKEYGWVIDERLKTFFELGFVLGESSEQWWRKKRTGNVEIIITLSMFIFQIDSKEYQTCNYTTWIGEGKEAIMIGRQIQIETLKELILICSLF